MKLSVIMPVYNREVFVGAALRSLLRQRDAAELDIIVVDDGSTDGSADVVRSMIDEVPCIRLFQQENTGVTRARNRGLNLLKPETELVSFLDSDDISPAAASAPSSSKWKRAMRQRESCMNGSDSASSAAASATTSSPAGNI